MGLVKATPPGGSKAHSPDYKILPDIYNSNKPRTKTVVPPVDTALCVKPQPGVRRASATWGG